MKVLGFILQKEFRQIFRDRTILVMMTMVPVIQLIILPFAANFEVKQVHVAFLDHDHSTYSRKLHDEVASSDYFQMIGYPASYQEALGLIENEAADLILEIPAGFEQHLIREGHERVFLAMDAINGTKSALGGSYLTAVLATFNQQTQTRLVRGSDQTIRAPKQLEIIHNTWFNPQAEYTHYMVPGILVLLLTMIAGFITALNIVKEKEIGTIEQINVTPIRKWQFILGKLIPFWIVGMLVFTLGLMVMYLVYRISPAGSIPTLYLFAGVYLIALLGFGLLVSTVSSTQLQAMFVAFFFVMIFILMSGFFTSIDSMPDWARQLSQLTPVTHFIRVVRLIVLKGSALRHVYRELVYLILFALVLNGLAIWNYRKTT